MTIYTHQENTTNSPFLWLRFIRGRRIEVLLNLLPPDIPLDKIDHIVLKLYPTAIRITHDGLPRTTETT